MIDWLIDFSLESLINVEINKELLYDLQLYVDYLHLPLGLAIGFKLYECLLDEKKYSFKIWFHEAKCFIYWGYNFKAYNMIL